MPEFVALCEFCDAVVVGIYKDNFCVGPVDVGECGCNNRFGSIGSPFGMVEGVAAGGFDCLSQFPVAVCNENSLVGCVGGACEISSCFASEIKECRPLCSVLCQRGVACLFAVVPDFVFSRYAGAE